MYQNKPIIGIVGGIGSGKSFVASLFAEQGCYVIDSDKQAKAAYDLPEVRTKIGQWWPETVRSDGSIDRKAVAARVFPDPNERLRLEHLLHPLVHQARDREMASKSADPQVIAFLWDTPLLIETGLHRDCDAVVFVDTPRGLRLKRVRETRGWDEGELNRRENSQTPLDTKRKISHYVVVNTADAGGPAEIQALRSQVRELLSLILANKKQTPALAKAASDDRP